MLMLPRGPVATSTGSSTWTTTRTLQTLDRIRDTTSTTTRGQAVIGLKKDQTWPSDLPPRRRRARAVQRGLQLAHLPNPGVLLQAMKLMIGHWYRNREETAAVQLYEIPMGAKILMMPHRRGMGV
jgi:hypothetical protein